MKMIRMMRNRAGRSLACRALLGTLFLTVSLTGIAQWPESAPSQVPAELAAPAVQIGPGDIITVTMFDAPELSGRFRVNEKGDIDLSLIGTVHVQGLTADQAARKIEMSYVQGQILQPGRSQAAVFIEVFANQGLVISGEVKSPGVYPAVGVRMLHDVVTAAGGVSATASSRVVIARRSDPQHPITVTYNPTALKPVVPEVQIFPGDSVMVPRAGIIYVAGNVTKPGSYVLDGRNALTIEELMALAGGGGHAAAMRRVQLMRTLEDGRKEMIIIPVDRIYKAQVPDVVLKDGDIVYVPTSRGKLATEQFLTSAIGVGTSLAIYKVGTQ
jgi:polysaccharide export outer membrane protein